MLKKLAIVPAFVAFLAGCGPRDAATIIKDANAKMGNPTSITVSGTAKDVAFQQCGANQADAQCRGTHDPMRPIDNFVGIIDLSVPTIRNKGVTHNIGPGGSTTIGEGTFFQQVTPAADTPWAQAIGFYMIPSGFLKGAEENNATTGEGDIDGVKHTMLSWSPAVKAPSGADYKINAYLNDDNLIVRTETWVEDNIMGDMHVVTDYSGWHEMGGTQLPAKMVQTRGGWPFMELEIASGEANPANAAEIAMAPEAPAGKGKGGDKGKGGPGGAPAAMVVEAEKLGDGLWRLTTGAGSYDTLVVEFNDHIMMMEAGGNQDRAVAYIAKAKELVPNKPITQIYNSHPHADHTGGLPALIAEGATIVTSKNNEEFFTRALNTPRTLLATNDTLAAHPMEAKVDPVDEKKVYTDGTRTVEIYHVWPVPHSNGLTIAYFPKEKIIFQGDFSINPPQPANDHVFALAPILKQLNLDFTRYINVHAPAKPQTNKDFWATVTAREKAGAASE